MAGRKILLVEGTDDEHVLKHICGNRGIPNLDDVRPHEGDQDLLEDFETQLRASTDEGDVVGIVIDADDDPAGRWQSIRNRLVQVGYGNVPAQADAEGTVINPPGESVLPRAGVWLMPNNQDRGKLEDFLRLLVRQNDGLIDYAADTVSSLPERRFGDTDTPKAVMHTWLAWQSSPGRPYGTAITAGFLDAGAVAVDGLVGWLNRLFFA